MKLVEGWFDLISWIWSHPHHPHDRSYAKRSVLCSTAIDVPWSVNSLQVLDRPELSYSLPYYPCWNRRQNRNRRMTTETMSHDRTRDDPRMNIFCSTSSAVSDRAVEIRLDSDPQSLNDSHMALGHDWQVSQPTNLRNVAVVHSYGFAAWKSEEFVRPFAADSFLPLWSIVSNSSDCKLILLHRWSFPHLLLAETSLERWRSPTRPCAFHCQHFDLFHHRRESIHQDHYSALPYDSMRHLTSRFVCNSHRSALLAPRFWSANKQTTDRAVAYRLVDTHQCSTGWRRSSCLRVVLPGSRTHQVTATDNR